ncbi:Rossmann-like domain-containing protein [uncultured Streptomyces sp.]|uniref:Rossmann-like domain-containing protein n=1 Tax=uncultured Streptomyces sp. TaxID=174707 RepID=UPI00261AD439|nr:DUF364 domain-containing protein [uncultured Streptomyces sp.]
MSGRTFEETVAAALAGEFGPDPKDARVCAAFGTRQTVRHHGRQTGYRNEVLSLRLGASVGSCAVAPGTLTDDLLDACTGASVARLLDDHARHVRVAALDAYLMEVSPHGSAAGAVPVTVPAGSSLERSTARARVVVDLLDPVPGSTVLVVGVVNSLLAEIRSRGARVIPCDLAGGRTEEGEPVVTDALAALPHCDTVLATGMTLGNGTFEPLRVRALALGRPLVMFAQTGSAVLPRFLGDGVTAVCAEPYPFFWLDGGAGVLHTYRAPIGALA